MRRLLLTLHLVFVSASYAQVDQCLPDLGNGNTCTANDITPALGSVSGPDGCTEGEYVSGIVATVTFVQPSGNSPDRYDIGLFIGNDGNSPINGTSCTFDSLTPQTLSPSEADLFNGAGPYRDIDGDACGDVSADDVTVKDVALEPVLCQDSDGDGKLDLDATITWSSNQTDQSCNDPADPAKFFPDSSSKCRSESNINLPIDVEPPPSIVVEKVATPSTILSGETVTFTVVVENTSGATDPLTLNSLNDSVYGDLNGQGTCVVPQTIAPGAYYSCAFDRLVAGATPSTHINTVTAQGVDDESVVVTDNDDAVVDIVAGPVSAAVAVRKLAVPPLIKEPGRSVRFDVLLMNAGSGTITLTGLTDDIYGVINNANGAISNNTCAFPTVLDPTVSRLYACSFEADVTGNAGDTHTNTITVTADPGGMTDNDSAVVQIVGVAPDIVVTKTATPRLMLAPGGKVTYTVEVENVGVEDVTLNTLDDGLFGNIADAGNAALVSTTCSTGQTIATGATYSCSFVANVTGNVSDFHTNTVIATAQDNDGATVSAFDRATVALLAFIPGLDPAKIPVLGGFGLLLLGSILGWMGARRLRR